MLEGGANKQKIAKTIAEKLNVSLHFTERIIYGKRKEIALVFILELLKYWGMLLGKTKEELENKKKEIQETFEFLKENSGARTFKIKAVKWSVRLSQR